MQQYTIEEFTQDHFWKVFFPKKHFTSISLPLPELFISYLQQDSVVVDQNDSNDETQSLLSSPEIMNFLNEIQASICKIQGKGVIPRLNWSAPK